MAAVSPASSGSHEAPWQRFVRSSEEQPTATDYIALIREASAAQTLVAAGGVGVGGDGGGGGGEDTDVKMGEASDTTTAAATGGSVANTATDVTVSVVRGKKFVGHKRALNVAFKSFAIQKLPKRTCFSMGKDSGSATNTPLHTPKLTTTTTTTTSVAKPPPLTVGGSGTSAERDAAMTAPMLPVTPVEKKTGPTPPQTPTATTTTSAVDLPVKSAGSPTWRNPTVKVDSATLFTSRELAAYTELAHEQQRCAQHTRYSNIVSDLHTTPLDDQVLRVYATNAPPKDPRFRNGSRALEQLVELPPSLVVYLHVEGYSLNDTGPPHPYDYASKDLLDGIDSGRIPADLSDVLSEMSLHYYDGCLIVELRDHRGGGSPVVRRVLLRPSTEAIMSDLDVIHAEQYGSSWSNDQRLMIESRLVLATEPAICLDPSPRVMQIAGAAHARRQLYARKRRKEKRDPSSFSSGFSASATAGGGAAGQAGAAAEKFKLVRFLNEQRRQGNPISSLQVDPLFRLPRPVLTDAKPGVKQVKEPSAAHRSGAPPKHVTLVRAVKFTTPPKIAGIPTFCMLEAYALPSGRYAAALRMGGGQDTGNNGTKITYPVGNRLEAERYVEQFMRLFQQEGNKCVYDSAIHGPLRRQQQQQAAQAQLQQAAVAQQQQAALAQQQQQQQQQLKQQQLQQARAAQVQAHAQAQALQQQQQQQQQQQLQQQQQQQQQQLQQQQQQLLAQRALANARASPQISGSPSMSAGLTPQQQQQAQAQAQLVARQQALQQQQQQHQQQQQLLQQQLLIQQRQQLQAQQQQQQQQQAQQQQQYKQQ